MKSKALPNRRRRSLVVEKDFQYRFTLKICLVNGLIFFIFGGLFLFFIRLNYEMLIQDALIQMPDMVENLRREFRLTALAMMSSIVIMMAVTFIFGLSLTNRIAGPLFALKRKLHEVASGQNGVRLSLRTRDEFRNLEEAFNLAMENSDLRFKGIIEDIEAALELIKKQEHSKARHTLEEIQTRHPKPKLFFS